MKFLSILNNKLEELHLLKHPFYQSWNEGTLKKDALVEYAKEYYHHVAAFPRYISQIHTLCNDISSRQILLDNLIEEEKGEENHPELWLRFLEGVAGNRKHDKNPQIDQTKKLVDGYYDLTKASYAKGLGALYAYERQTSKISRSKIDGLKKHYDIHDEKTLQFFEVHSEVDEWHTEELKNLIEKLSTDDHKDLEEGAMQGARLLWNFLDGINQLNQ